MTTTWYLPPRFAVPTSGCTICDTAHLQVEQSEADGAASEEAAAGYCVVGTGDNGTDWDPNSQIAASHLQSMGELMMRGASAVRRHLP